MLSILYLSSWEYYHLECTDRVPTIFFLIYCFKVFSFYTWDSWVFWFFEVTGSLDSLLLRRLYCIMNKGLALFLGALICCLDKAFSDKPDVVCKQTPPVSMAGESLEYSTWEQLLLYQSDTVIYEVSNPLAFEEFRPSHLSFVFISVVLVTHCPCKPRNGSVDLVAHEWRVVSPFLGWGNKAVNEKSGESGKVSHCALLHLTPQSSAWSSKGKGSFPARGFSFGGVSEWKMLEQPFLFLRLFF